MDKEIIDYLDNHFNKTYFLEFDNSEIVLAPKRGNRAYDCRVYGRIKEIKQRMQDITYVDENVSNLIHVTLTYPDNGSSWEEFGEDTRYFMDRLRKDATVGMTDYVITVEATGKGVAHAHLLIKTEFCFRYHIDYKYNPLTQKKFKHGVIDDSELVKSIQDKWPHISSVDACYSKGAVNYVLKYILKGFTGVKAIFLKAKYGAILSDEEKKKLLGLYGVVKNNKRFFRVSRSFVRGYCKVEPVKMDCPDKLKAGRCWLCEQLCLNSLVIIQAQCRKTRMTRLWDYKAVRHILGSIPPDIEIKEAVVECNKISFVEVYD